MRFLTTSALAFLLAACAPAFQPSEGHAPGVTLTATETEHGTLYRVDTDFPVDRLFLRFHGDGLNTNAPECDVTPGAIECVIGAVTSFYELHVVGIVRNDFALPVGVVCRADCFALYLTH